MLLPIEVGSYFYAYPPVFLAIRKYFPPSASIFRHPPREY
jgi:hypothetical protein